MCALLGLLDPASLLRVEQLRYLKQLVGFAPDAVYGHLYVRTLTVLRQALSWLYDPVRVTCRLPDPLTSWQPWYDRLQERPSQFRGRIQRARGLNICRISSFAAMQTLHRTLSDHGAGEPLRESPGKTAFTEDCLICNRAFTSWAAWACHASKIHRWRTATSVCAGTQGDSLCRGAARFSRNQRSFVGICCILKHAQVMCRTGWGSCVLGPDQAIPSIHTCTPPPALEGVLREDHCEYDPAAYSRG